MLSKPAISQIPFPDGWLRPIRSVVAHTIPLAQTSLTYARSAAANSVNARIRLEAEIRRLRHRFAFDPTAGAARH